MQTGAQHFREELAQLASNGADAERIAGTALARWRSVEAALSPIVGLRGVAALLKRSVSQTRAEYPWLAAALLPGADDADDFSLLRAALSQRSSADAAAANGALLEKFLDLLIHLIGESLTERLLRPVWDNTSTGDAVREPLR